MNLESKRIAPPQLGGAGAKRRGGSKADSFSVRNHPSHDLDYVSIVLPSWLRRAVNLRTSLVAITNFHFGSVG